MWVWVLEGHAADPAEIGRQLARWSNEFGDTPGYLGATGGVTDDGRFILFVRWETEEAGNELLTKLEQLTWYVEFQSNFDGDVDFAETDEVATLLAGGSDDAGFVQAIKVAGVDRERIDNADREFERVAARVRPDLIGGIRVWTTPDGFVEMNYFVSEEAARHGEQQPPPADIADAVEDLMATLEGATFYDFTEPFLHSPSR